LVPAPSLLINQDDTALADSEPLDLFFQTSTATNPLQLPLLLSASLSQSLILKLKEINVVNLVAKFKLLEIKAACWRADGSCAKRCKSEVEWCNQY
jgi:hypothetical protein